MVMTHLIFKQLQPFENNHHDIGSLSFSPCISPQGCLSVLRAWQLASPTASDLRARPSSVPKIEDPGLPFLKLRQFRAHYSAGCLEERRKHLRSIQALLSKGLQPTASVYQKESLHPMPKPDNSPKESNPHQSGDIWVLKCRKCLSSFLCVSVLKYTLDCKPLESSTQPSQPLSNGCHWDLPSCVSVDPSSIGSQLSLSDTMYLFVCFWLKRTVSSSKVFCLHEINVKHNGKSCGLQCDFSFDSHNLQGGHCDGAHFSSEDINSKRTQLVGREPGNSDPCLLTLNPVLSILCHTSAVQSIYLIEHGMVSRYGYSLHFSQVN